MLPLECLDFFKINDQKINNWIAKWCDEEIYLGLGWFQIYGVSFSALCYEKRKEYLHEFC